MAGIWKLIGGLVAVATLMGCADDDDIAAVGAAGDSAVLEEEDHDEDHDEDHEDHDEDHEDHDKDREDHEDHEDDGARGLGSHVHGEAELSIGISGGDIVVDLVSPSDNVFGFEYEPTTDEDVTFAADQIALLTSADLLAFNEEAGCAVTDVQTAQEFDGSHAEVTASWTFLCENADSVTQLDLSAVFEAFPGFVEIDAAWASEETQSAAELTPSASIVRFG